MICYFYLVDCLYLRINLFVSFEPSFIEEVKLLISVCCVGGYVTCFMHRLYRHRHPFRFSALMIVVNKQLLRIKGIIFSYL